MRHDRLGKFIAQSTKSGARVPTSNLRRVRFEVPDLHHQTSKSVDCSNPAALPSEFYYGVVKG